MLIYSLCWLLYVSAALVIYRFYLRELLPPWFPNSYPIARILVLTMLFSPALMVDNGNVFVAPTLLALAFQVLLKSPLGMLKASVLWLLVTSIVFLLAAARNHQRAGGTHQLPVER